MYSKMVREFLMSPVNGSGKGPYNGVGRYEGESRCAANPTRETTNVVEFRVSVDASGTIRDLRWKVFGDPVAIATASWCVREFLGKPVEGAVRLAVMERVAPVLGIREDAGDRGGCEVTLRALVNAFNDYQNRCSLEGPGPSSGGNSA